MDTCHKLRGHVKNNKLRETSNLTKGKEQHRAVYEHQTVVVSTCQEMRPRLRVKTNLNAGDGRPRGIEKKRRDKDCA